MKNPIRKFSLTTVLIIVVASNVISQNCVNVDIKGQLKRNFSIYNGENEIPKNALGNIYPVENGLKVRFELDSAISLAGQNDKSVCIEKWLADSSSIRIDGNFIRVDSSQISLIRINGKLIYEVPLIDTAKAGSSFINGGESRTFIIRYELPGVLTNFEVYLDNRYTVDVYNQLHGLYEIKYGSATNRLKSFGFDNANTDSPWFILDQVPADSFYFVPQKDKLNNYTISTSVNRRQPTIFNGSEVKKIGQIDNNKEINEIQILIRSFSNKILYSKTIYVQLRKAPRTLRITDFNSQQKEVTAGAVTSGYKTISFTKATDLPSEGIEATTGYKMLICFTPHNNVPVVEGIIDEQLFQRYKTLAFDSVSFMNGRFEFSNPIMLFATSDGCNKYRSQYDSLRKNGELGITILLTNYGRPANNTVTGDLLSFTITNSALVIGKKYENNFFISQINGSDTALISENTSGGNVYFNGVVPKLFFSFREFENANGLGPNQELEICIEQGNTKMPFEFNGGPLVTSLSKDIAGDVKIHLVLYGLSPDQNKVGLIRSKGLPYTIATITLRPHHSILVFEVVDRDNKDQEKLNGEFTTDTTSQAARFFKVSASRTDAYSTLYLSDKFNIAAKDKEPALTMALAGNYCEYLFQMENAESGEFVTLLQQTSTSDQFADAVGKIDKEEWKLYRIVVKYKTPDGDIISQYYYNIRFIKQQISLGGPEKGITRVLSIPLSIDATVPLLRFGNGLSDDNSLGFGFGLSVGLNPRRPELRFVNDLVGPLKFMWMFRATQIEDGSYNWKSGAGAITFSSLFGALNWGIMIKDFRPGGSSFEGYLGINVVQLQKVIARGSNDLWRW